MTTTTHSHSGWTDKGGHVKTSQFRFPATLRCYALIRRRTILQHCSSWLTVEYIAHVSGVPRLLS
jgi:hypothetical protein